MRLFLAGRERVFNMILIIFAKNALGCSIINTESKDPVFIQLREVIQPFILHENCGTDSKGIYSKVYLGNYAFSRSEILLLCYEIFLILRQSHLGPNMLMKPSLPQISVLIICLIAVV